MAQKMTIGEVGLAVHNIIAKELCLESIPRRENRLVEDLEADSLDLLGISVKLEERFGREIPPRNFEMLRTVEDVVNYIFTHQESESAV